MVGLPPGSSAEVVEDLVFQRMAEDLLLLPRGGAADPTADGLQVKNDEFCIKNDEFQIKNDDSSGRVGSELQSISRLLFFEFPIESAEIVENAPEN